MFPPLLYSAFFSWLTVCSTLYTHVNKCVFPGIGAAYGRAENEIKELVELSGLPFLPTPMGKGVLPDDHPNCVAAARSRCGPLPL